MSEVKFSCFRYIYILKIYIKRSCFLFYACVFACVNVYAPCVCGAYGGWKTESDPLKLEWWVFMRCHVNARNGTWASGLSNKCP